jgi:hypothetical protein
MFFPNMCLHICFYYNRNTKAEDYKTEIGDQSQISRIWLAEMENSLKSQASDAWDFNLVYIISFIIFRPDKSKFISRQARAENLSSFSLWVSGTVQQWQLWYTYKLYVMYDGHTVWLVWSS